MAARGDAGRPDGTLLTVADVLAQTATGKQPTHGGAGGAETSGSSAGNVRDDASSSGSSGSSDLDTDGHDWLRDYVPSLGARSHTPAAAPAREGAGAKKRRKRSKLRQSGGKGF